MNFEEGKDYTFIIRSIISLPDDDYYMIEYTDGRKFLMRKKFYSDVYALAPGKEITCRLDKINCNGKLFFEPHHPFYSPGLKDIFIITGESTRKFKKTEGTYIVLTATGPKGDTAIIKETDVENLNDFKTGDRVAATIKKISRGELHLVEVRKAGNT